MRREFLTVAQRVVTELDVRLESALRAAGGAPELPARAVTAAYGGPFRLPERVVYANFVSSIDGVAAIAGVEMSSAAISGGAPADRFVMALLRAVADAVVVGAGTVREHGGPWTAEKAFPPGAEAFPLASGDLGERVADARRRDREREAPRRTSRVGGRDRRHDVGRRSVAHGARVGSEM